MSTFFVKNSDLKGKKWRLVDAKGEVVGRLAARISRILSGRDKTDYTPFTEMGDGVIVINASQAYLTSTKAKTKRYKFYSGYPKGLRDISYEDLQKTNPTYALKHAVKGMLPKNRLGSRMITRLLVYAGSEHPHGAQLAGGRAIKTKSKVEEGRSKEKING